MTDIVAPISPAEIAADLLTRYGTTVGNTIPATGTVAAVKVGPASDEEQQAGIISIMAAGLPVVEKYTPIQWMRAQIRCIGPDLDTADFLAQCVQRDIHSVLHNNGVIRKLCYQTSNDSWYLVHLCNITAGPSMHYDSPETWETLLFAELMIGEQVVATGPDFPG